MPTFTSKSPTPSRLSTQLRKRPFLFFGLPFLSLVVASSFALQEFTQTRYDLHGQKVKTLSVEEGLGMSKDRKKVDIREEYYRLNAITSSIPDDRSLDASTSSQTPATPSTPIASSSSSSPEATQQTSARPKKSKLSFAPTSQDDYEPVRVPRPMGVPEWGSGGRAEEAPLKGQRKTDRWV